MVANLETEMTPGSFGECTAAVNGGKDGDFTGTYIKSDKPVVVFTSNERGAGFGGAENVVYPPGWDAQTGDTCCTDHLEEQLFPVTALGREFAVARSPIRSTHPTWTEPDIIRVVGTADGTAITTSLPAPYDSFTLNARQDRTFAATTGFTLSATAAVQVSSYLVSQHFVKHGYFGVFAKPVDAQVMLDGIPLDGIEFSSCVRAPIGTVAGIVYEQVTCPLAEGHHTVTANKPFGLSVYGYYSVGSYAFVGGSDVKIINPIL